MPCFAELQAVSFRVKNCDKGRNELFSRRLAAGITLRKHDLIDPFRINRRTFDQRPDQTYRTGAIVNFAEPMAQIDAANQWNTFDIVMDGDHLMVTMNGTLMVDTRDSSFAAGPIAFQWSAGTVRVRNLRLRPL